ncbi:hypothetical protein [Fodinicola acaciae]|uniref:hypothetical protein n=1 Tax=Fodinicola acaciae TaxID=2681555 RepID=UPI0013D00654|nr:hypothetical protein [Fodinicola acaciae]
MNTLRTLHDAFAELEKRADATPVQAHIVPERPARGRLAAPLLTAAAVAAVVAGVALWQQPVGNRTVQPPAAPAANKAATYTPPDTAAKLAAKARTILAGVATVTLDNSRSSNCGAVIVKVGPRASHDTDRSPTRLEPDKKPRTCSGAAIGGRLTRGNATGGFDLAVYRTSRGEKASCDQSGDCSLRTLPDGSTLAISTWRDPHVPGGLTTKIELVRADLADINMHLSTEADPKGSSARVGTTLPLTVEQLTAFVSSHRW